MLQGKALFAMDILESTKNIIDLLHRNVSVTLSGTNSSEI